MICPACRGLGYTVIPWDPRHRKNPGKESEQEARLPCVSCNGTGRVTDKGVPWT